MRTVLLVALLVLAADNRPARAQFRFRDRVNTERLNRRLAGRVVDYTHNEGTDHRIYSTVLGRPRDLYVYLPPGYDPNRLAYPLVVYLHMSDVDEHTFAGSNRIVELDRMISRGEFPPAVVVSPDGTIGGENRTDAEHSLFVNGRHGRFQEYLLVDVLPFVMSHYSIRPEREAHALIGVSAGGFGAMNLALKRRDLFGSVATLAGPLNLRYGSTSRLGHLADFDPATYRPLTRYDPDAVVGRYYFGLMSIRARRFLDPLLGAEIEPAAFLLRENPADLIESTDLRPGELQIYANYPALDNYNFDAQAESFAWLAARRGVRVILARAPIVGHGLPYFIRYHVAAFRWLSCHLLPPAALTTGP